MDAETHLEIMKNFRSWMQWYLDNNANILNATRVVLKMVKMIHFVKCILCELMPLSILGWLEPSLSLKPILFGLPC